MLDAARAELGRRLCRPAGALRASPYPVAAAAGVPVQVVGHRSLQRGRAAERIMQPPALCLERHASPREHRATACSAHDLEPAEAGRRKEGGQWLGVLACVAGTAGRHDVLAGQPPARGGHYMFPRPVRGQVRLAIWLRHAASAIGASHSPSREQPIPFVTGQGWVRIGSVASAVFAGIHTAHHPPVGGGVTGLHSSDADPRGGIGAASANRLAPTTHLHLR